MDRLSRMDMINKLLENEPSDIFLNYALGVEHFAELNLPDAEKQFKKVLELNPDYVPVLYQLGKLCESKADNKEALKYYLVGLEKAKAQKNNKAASEFDEAIFMLGA
jgi:tetratricopeptide (TPR) repeat protein